MSTNKETRNRTAPSTKRLEKEKTIDCQDEVLPTPFCGSSATKETEVKHSTVTASKQNLDNSLRDENGENDEAQEPDASCESGLLTKKQHQESLSTRLEGVNPQDPTFPIKDKLNYVPNSSSFFEERKENKRRRGGRKRRENDHQKPEKNDRRSRRNWKKRKGGHLVRVASVESDEDDHSIGPCHQYRVTLKRRAIHKLDELASATQPPSWSTTKQRRNIFSSYSEDSPSCKRQSSDEEKDDEEECGDVTLGMKLVILGGKVIVQHLNALSDGRASPAQLVGVVRRGDVLLSIDNVSLVKLRIEQLADALKPLSSPDATSGAFKRSLNLCFAAGEGLKLLTKSESSAFKIAAFAANADSVGSDVFSLFPMVDQLSGMPLFESFGASAFDLRVAISDQEETKQAVDDEPLLPKEESGIDQKHLAVDEVISRSLADQRVFDRAKYTSAYYSWNTIFSELLRPSKASLAAAPRRRQSTNKVTRAQVLQQGMKALFGASKLTQNLSNLDRGKDMRSFKHWNTTLSLRSRASSRRKFLLEVTSLPAGLRIDTVESHSDDDSAVTNASEEYEGIDPDELLLRLAAHDDIWRRQVLSTLNDAVHEMENYNESDGEKENNVAESLAIPDIDAAISKQLGSFLFGEQMAKIVSKRKKTFVLPPSDVTSVLFDLVTQLASTRPDEVAVVGGTGSSVSVHASSVKVPKQSFLKSDVKAVLAAQFVLNKALPLWLKSFRPLPWEQRRVLWPYAQHATGDVHTLASMTHSDDSLTVDSGLTASPNASPRQRRNLREVIEDMELDVEARAEVCFLVSYYFTEALLPRLRNQLCEGNQVSFNEDIKEFVNCYGAYLQLHTCLASAAAIEADGVIEILLNLAKHDPRHLEAMKQLSKSNALLLYDPSMLSAIVQRLRVIRSDKRVDVRRSLKNLAAAAFPDVRPWQLRTALLGPSNKREKKDEEDLGELYYEYLSLLLHPLHGNPKARRDASLIQEWCLLSAEYKADAVKGGDERRRTRRENFLAVASRSSSHHLCYHRDLPMLLDLSMQANEFNLALDVAGEILDHRKYTMGLGILESVVQHLRKLIRFAVDVELVVDQQSPVPKLLTRILRIFHKMATHKSYVVRDSISVPQELYSLIDYAFKAQKENDAVRFLSTIADPSDVLQSANLWTTSQKLERKVVLSALHTILRRASVAGVGMELSGSLLRIKQARGRREGEGTSVGVDHQSLYPKQSIWRLMYNGNANIDK